MYKVIYNDTIIDVLSSLTYVKYQPKNQLNLITNSRDGAFGIMSSDSNEIYHLDSLDAPEVGSYKTVSIEDISEDEYLQLMESFNKEIPEPMYTIDPNATNVVIVKDLDTAIAKKLEQLSAVCNQTIISGFEVTLTDGVEYHFDLTIEDQINLASLTLLAAQGTDAIPYHASGELCKFYSAADITLITNKASELKTYHTTYYNSLKNYVKSLKTIEEVEAVQYGDLIPEEFRSEVMITLIGG